MSGSVNHSLSPSSEHFCLQLVSRKWQFILFLSSELFQVELCCQTMATQYLRCTRQDLIIFLLIPALKPDNAAHTLQPYYKLTFNFSMRFPVKVLTETHQFNCTCSKHLICYQYDTNNSYLLQVSVAPRFTISKYLRSDSAILVILHAYRHSTSLDTCHMSARGIGDIDSIQATAWCPQSRPPSMIVMNP